MNNNWNFEGLTKDNIIPNSSFTSKEHNNSSNCCSNEDSSNKLEPCCGLDKTYPDTSKIDNPITSRDYFNKLIFKNFKEFTKKFGDISISYVNNIQEFFLEDYESEYTSAILIRIEMDNRILNESAGSIAQYYNDKLYEKLGNYTYEFSDYLRENGYKTKVAHPYENLIDFSKLGEKAGTGAIGKSGLLISPEWGPSQKISCILLNINNLPDHEINPHIWIKEYCKYCGACLKACPQDALVDDTCCVKLNQNKCVGCTKGCSECIKICPFYKRGYNQVKKIFNKIKIK